MNKTKMKTELDAARAIAAKAEAEGRDLTDAEVAKAQTHLKAYEAAKNEPDDNAGKIEKARQLRKNLAAIGLDLGLGHDDDEPASHHVLRNGYKGTLAASWATKAAERMTTAREPLGGAKAMVAVGVEVPTPITDPVPMPLERHTILNLVKVRTVAGSSLDGGAGGNTFGYTVQTTRDTNADAVPDGTLKPTSVYSWTEKVDRFRTIAHLSEPQPNRLLADRPTLTKFLQDEMARGLLDAVEAQILAGTGTIAATEPVTPTAATEQLPGILNTSGILTQAYDTDLLTTLSAAYDTITMTDEEPTAWVMHPLDYRQLKNMRESGTTGPLMFKSGRSSIEQILGELPIIASTLITQGVALLGDFRQVELVMRDSGKLESTQGDQALFDYNLTKFRAELRAGLAVLRPAAFIEVDLTAA